MPAVPASSPVVSSKHNDSIRDPPCPHPLLPTGKRIFLFSIASLLPDIIHEFALLRKTLVRVRNPRNESSDEETIEGVFRETLDSEKILQLTK